MSDTLSGKVLVAEDSSVQGKKLKYYLEQQGHRVVWKQDGLEALRELEGPEGPSYELLITDIQMPQMDGMELLRQVKANGALKYLPVIVLTTLTNRDIHLESINLGVSEFLNKPFVPEELWPRVGNLLKLRRFETALIEDNRRLNEDLGEKNRLLELKLNELRESHEELKEAQVQLSRASKVTTVGFLGAGVAHEISNPVAIIQACSDRLESLVGKQNADLGEISKLNSKIGRSIDRITGVVGHLKKLARRNESQEGSRDFDLNEVLRGLSQFYLEFAKEQGIEVKEALSAAPIFVKGTEAAIEHAFLNMIQNAFEAMETSEKKVLSIGSSIDESGFAVIEIGDTGIGISAETREKVFEPFFTTKPPGKGMGLGLSLVSSYIKTCDGKVDFETTSDGTVFKTTLKVAA